MKNSGSLDCQFVDSHAFIVKINILNQVVVCKFVKLLEKKIIAKWSNIEYKDQNDSIIFFNSKCTIISIFVQLINYFRKKSSCLRFIEHSFKVDKILRVKKKGNQRKVLGAFADCVIKMCLGRCTPQIKSQESMFTK